jgi:hypothetical protein
LAYSTGVMGTVTVNYYYTLYGYDSDGNLVRTQTPNGTVYNSLGEAISAWVGTNDTPTSGECVLDGDHYRHRAAWQSSGRRSRGRRCQRRQRLWRRHLRGRSDDL